MTFLLKSPCPVCHGHCELVDVLDFHKMCGDPGLHFRGLSGQPIYYALCESCGFCFAPTIAQWGHQEFEDRIYNQDYIQVDPEYVEIRPQGFRTRLLQLFGGYSDQFSHLDYGGGNGRLSELLRESGWNSRSYDPFVNKDVDRQQLGKFDLITAFEVFEHVPDPLALMESLHGLLAPSGVLHFSTQLSDGHIQLGQRLNWWYAAPRNGHISLFSNNSLQFLAQKHHFTLASDWASLHAMYTSKPAWAARLIP